jgi:arylsulfatase A-like enzyme
MARFPKADIWQPQTRPNVIWVFGDQHRAQATGYAGDPNVATPNLDRLVGEGWSSSAAVAGQPLCCPFRGSLLTSRYPHHCVPGHEYPLPNGQPTIATVLNEAGYRTAYFGKWHLGGFKEAEGRAAMHIIPPDQRGDFDLWVGYENNNSQWDTWVHGGEGDGAFHYRLPGFETNALTDMLIDYLRTQANDEADGTAPFFAVLSVQPPHNPCVAPEEWMRRHTPGKIVLRPNVPAIDRIQEQARRELAGYYAQIENLDWNVGRIREALAETGLAHNTHILFFSDHGDSHGSQGQFRKTNPWEEALRIPFIVAGHVPRYAHLGGRSPVPVNHVDIAPTTLGLCGIDAPEWMEGTDYAGYRLRDRQVRDEPDSAFIQSVIPHQYANGIDRAWRGVVTRDGWKYVVLEHQPWLLYNLNEDPYEQVNLAFNKAYVQQRRRLQDRLAAWIRDTDDEFPLPEV